MGTLPNFPLLLTEWCTAFGSNGGSVPNQYVDLSPRTQDGTAYKEGKQYELDTIQAGEATTTLQNLDSALDPTNTSGPYAGQINPYQGFRVRAQYPPTQNLLPQAVASGGEGWSVGTIPHSGAGTTNFNMYSATDATGFGSIVVPSDGAYSGTNAFQFNVPSSTAAGQWIGSYISISTVPGQPYSFQLRVRNVTASTSITVHPTLGWFSPTSAYGPASLTKGGDFVLTGATTGAAWQLITVSGIAPTNACGVTVGFRTSFATTSACNVQADVWQAEEASAPTTYTYPGVWYPVMSGFVERWPTKWKESGTYGTLTPTITDAFGLMSMGQLSDPLTEEIQSNGARFLYRLDDQSSSAFAGEAKGNYPPLSPVSYNTGGTLTFGNSITATDPVNGIFTAGGTSPKCVTITPTTAGTEYLSLSNSQILGPASGTFTRMIAFRFTGTVTTANVSYWLWNSSDITGVNDVGMFLLSSGTSNSAGGQLGFYFNAGGGLLFTPTGVNVFDGNWHLAMFGYNSSTTATLLSIDGQIQSSTDSLGTLPKIVNDQIGFIGQGNSTAYVNANFSGSFAYAAEFPSVLSSSQISNLYSAWKNACSGESSSARYARILRYAGYTGPYSLQGGLTQQMGPATDLAGSDALTCLNNVVVTENGTHWIDGYGQPRFQGRDQRYNPGTPTYIFGENTAAGEWPYENLELDYDTTHLTNDVAVTQNSTGQAFYSQSVTGQTAFMDRTMSRTINVLNASEAQDCAGYLVYRYSKPLTRVVSIVLNPAAVANMWPVALSLGVGQLIQINRRPFGCPEISLEVWIEQIQWDFDGVGGAKLTLQCSPVDPSPAAQFAVWQSSLWAQATAGNNYVAVTSANDMVNPLNAQLYPGMQLVVHSNGGVASETMTVQSVQATGSNWTSGTVTFTSNLTLTHPVGTNVSEPAPGISLVSQLGQYNGNAGFDSVVFIY